MSAAGKGKGTEYKLTAKPGKSKLSKEGSRKKWKAPFHIETKEREGTSVIDPKIDLTTGQLTGRLHHGYLSMDVNGTDTNKATFVSSLQTIFNKYPKSSVGYIAFDNDTNTFNCFFPENISLYLCVYVGKLLGDRRKILTLLPISSTQEEKSKTAKNIYRTIPLDLPYESSSDDKDAEKPIYCTLLMGPKALSTIDEKTVNKTFVATRDPKEILDSVGKRLLKNPAAKRDGALLLSWRLDRSRPHFVLLAESSDPAQVDAIKTECKQYCVGFNAHVLEQNERENAEQNERENAELLDDLDLFTASPRQKVKSSEYNSTGTRKEYKDVKEAKKSETKKDSDKTTEAKKPETKQDSGKTTEVKKDQSLPNGASISACNTPRSKNEKTPRKNINWPKRRLEAPLVMARFTRPKASGLNIFATQRELSKNFKVAEFETIILKARYLDTNNLLFQQIGITNVQPKLTYCTDEKTCSEFKDQIGKVTSLSEPLSSLIVAYAKQKSIDQTQQYSVPVCLEMGEIFPLIPQAHSMDGYECITNDTTQECNFDILKSFVRQLADSCNFTYIKEGKRQDQKSEQDSIQLTDLISEQNFIPAVCLFLQEYEKFIKKLPAANYARYIYLSSLRTLIRWLENQPQFASNKLVETLHDRVRDQQLCAAAYAEPEDCEWVYSPPCVFPESYPKGIVRSALLDPDMSILFQAEMWFLARFLTEKAKRSVFTSHVASLSDHYFRHVRYLEILAEQKSDDGYEEDSAIVSSVKSPRPRLGKSATSPRLGQQSPELGKSPRVERKRDTNAADLPTVHGAPTSAMFGVSAHAAVMANSDASSQAGIQLANLPTKSRATNEAKKNEAKSEAKKVTLEQYLDYRKQHINTSQSNTVASLHQMFFKANYADIFASADELIKSGKKEIVWDLFADEVFNNAMMEDKNIAKSFTTFNYLNNLREELNALEKQLGAVDEQQEVEEPQPQPQQQRLALTLSSS